MHESLLKTNLIATYEDLLKIEPQQRVTEWYGDYGIYTFKYGITDEQIQPVYEKALDAIGMTDEELHASADLFPYRQDMIDRMSEHLSSIPDPTITPEEMREYGYTWEWMHPLRPETAERLFNKNAEIMQLFPDGTESVVKSLDELKTHDNNGGIFGIEKLHWDYLCETNALVDFHDIQAEIIKQEPLREEQLTNGKEDTFGIYQLTPIDANAEIMFESHSRMLATDKQIDRKNYQLVYTAPLDPQMTLDGIYQKFNLDLPQDYRGRSLSVSDIVVLRQNGEISAHYVDSIGFKEVPNFLRRDKKLTPEQEDVEYSKLPDQPKKSPQDKLKEITDKLEEGVTAMCESEQYKTYLNTLSKFYNYSLNNSILIWMQRPEAIAVAGYNAWKKKFGRQVKKGEHGITIIAPCPSKKTEKLPKLDPKTMELMYDEEGNPIMQSVQSSSLFFKATTVFDVSQTEGKPLPEAPIHELKGDIESYQTMLQALIQAAPCPVTFGDPGGGALGSFSRTTQSITIKEDMNQQQTLATLVHEIGHACLHSVKEEALKLPRGTREVQAESVAYTVCNHYGIDTSAWTFGYVATWSKGQELKTLRESLDTIRSTSAQIINKTDEQLQLILGHEQKNDQSFTQSME